MKIVILILFAVLLSGTISAKATLTLTLDARGRFHRQYDYHQLRRPGESSHVQVRIGSTGGILAAPQYGFQAPGDYTIVQDKSGFPRGDYLCTADIGS